MNTATIGIEGMHCEGCAQRITRVLEREPGVREADVSLDRGEARVRFDEHATTLDRLREAVERAGYTARVAA
jgi:copper chaperone